MSESVHGKTEERIMDRDAPASPRCLLAIDSSTEQAGVALFDGVRRAEVVWDAGRTQTTSLLGQIHHLLDLLGMTVADLGAVAVATGPGTFNGLRVGVSVAKGLALGLDLPLLGVPTLQAAALPFATGARPVVPVVAAGRGRLVWAMSDGDGAGWTERRPPRNGTVDELASWLIALERPVVVGELDQEQEARIRAVDGVTIPPVTLRSRRPGAVAELAWRRWQAGDVDDPAALEPVYLGR